MARAWPRAAQHLFFCLLGGYTFYKKLANNNCVLIHYTDRLREKEVALHILLFFLFYTFIHHTSSRRYDKCIKGNSWLDGWR